MITRLRISGMTCQRCVQAVYTSLTPVPGVTTAVVAIGSAEIEHDGRATAAELSRAIGVCGYEVVEIEEGRGGLPILSS